MREIKYRAWDLEEKKMYYEPYCIDSRNMGRGSLCVTPGDEGCENGKMGLYYGDEIDFALMQYTGLLDNNGKEIYEGDIVKREWDWTRYEALYLSGKEDHVISINVVTWMNESACWGLTAKGNSGTIFTTLYTRNHPNEVIGNIYENPELLEEKKDEVG